MIVFLWLSDAWNPEAAYKHSTDGRSGTACRTSDAWEEDRPLVAGCSRTRLSTSLPWSSCSCHVYLEWSDTKKREINSSKHDELSIWLVNAVMKSLQTWGRWCSWERRESQDEEEEQRSVGMRGKGEGGREREGDVQGRGWEDGEERWEREGGVTKWKEQGLALWSHPWRLATAS